MSCTVLLLNLYCLLFPPPSCLFTPVSSSNIIFIFIHIEQWNICSNFYVFSQSFLSVSCQFFQFSFQSLL
jgi:hypothetical protein